MYIFIQRIINAGRNLLMPRSRLANYAHDSQLNTRTKFTTRGLRSDLCEILTFSNCGTITIARTSLQRLARHRTCAARIRTTNIAKQTDCYAQRARYEFYLTLNFFLPFSRVRRYYNCTRQRLLLCSRL